MPSPYEQVLGEQLFALHPRLRDYFGAIPEGFVGRGSGMFSTVGTSKRWLWPALWVLKKQGVLFPVWEQDVPFTVVNRRVSRSEGGSAVAAIRTFHFRGGDQSMVDTIEADPAGLVDHLGTRRRYRAELIAWVEGGALRMISMCMSIRFGRVAIPVPLVVAPRVQLTERFDETDQRQHVSVTVSAPIIGRIYEYVGSFDYELQATEGESA